MGGKSSKPKPNAAVLKVVAKGAKHKKEKGSRKSSSSDFDDEASLAPSMGDSSHSLPGGRMSKSAGFQYLPDKEGKSRMQWLKCKEIIGSGAFGRVYLGLNPVDGELICCKEMAFVVDEYDLPKRDKMIANVQKEVDTLKTLNGHPNIVTFIDSEIEASAGTVRIFMEYCPCGTLATVVKKFGKLPEITVSCYTRQMLSGLSHLHRKGVVHRDIKPSNVLLDVMGIVKLADFGAAKTVKMSETGTMGSDLNTLTGTPTNLAPEVLTSNAYGQKVDVWSLGCTVLELASGKPPWIEFIDKMNARGGGGAGQGPALMMHIAESAKNNNKPGYPENMSPLLTGFLDQSFEVDPSKRPKIKELEGHGFILKYCGAKPGTAARQAMAMTPGGGNNRSNSALPWNNSRVIPAGHEQGGDGGPGGANGQGNDAVGFNQTGDGSGSWDTTYGAEGGGGGGTMETENNGHLPIGDSMFSSQGGAGANGTMGSDGFALGSFQSDTSSAGASPAAATDKRKSKLKKQPSRTRVVDTTLSDEGSALDDDDDDDDDDEMDSDDEESSDDDDDEAETPASRRRSAPYTPSRNEHDDKHIPQTTMAQEDLEEYEDRKKRTKDKADRKKNDDAVFQLEQEEYRAQLDAERRAKKKKK